MTVIGCSLTSDSASIQPDRQDFEMVEREVGPLSLDVPEKEAAHRYRLAKALWHFGAGGEQRAAMTAVPCRPHCVLNLEGTSAAHRNAHHLLPALQQTSMVYCSQNPQCGGGWEAVDCLEDTYGGRDFRGRPGSSRPSTSQG